MARVAYVTHTPDDAVSIVTVATTGVTTIAIPQPLRAGVSPDGSRLYVTSGDNSV